MVLDKKELKKILKVAIKCAKESGKIIRKNFYNGKKVDIDSEHDLKINIDKLAEKKVISIIQEKFPDHSIITEEFGVIEKNSEYCWIIDPLDGTVNYFYGVPYFCTCIACYKIDKKNLKKYIAKEITNDIGTGIVGVVYMPITKDMYYGAYGIGAYKNKIKLNANGYNSLKEIITITATGSTPDIVEKTTNLIKILSDKAKKVRIYGATGLDIVNVASKSAGLFVQKSSNIWDFAASKVIVDEAKGLFKFKEIMPGKYDIIATSEKIYQEVLDYLKNCSIII